MKVLIDYHHADLWESWQLLLADRFGWELYAPFGMSWYDEAYWLFEAKWHADAVARQYLLGVWTETTERDGYIERIDRTHPGRTIRGVTVEQARELHPDIVIATVPDNEPGFHRFARSVGAKYGVQIGNQWQHSDWERADFGLVSATLDYRPSKPHVVYRQEFSLADFAPTPPPRDPSMHIGSFVQCLPENPKAYAEFRQYATRNPEHRWSIYGSYGSHDTDEFARGNLGSTPAVAEGMRGTDVIWHTKEWSDGYGHVIHNAFAVGRPVFGRYGYYNDKLAGPLWVDGQTSIDIGTRTTDEVARILRRVQDDEDYHLRLCENAARRFREIVDFDDDAERIRAMLDEVMG